jgi:hypothetical protein
MKNKKSEYWQLHYNCHKLIKKGLVIFGMDIYKPLSFIAIKHGMTAIAMTMLSEHRPKTEL